MNIEETFVADVIEFNRDLLGIAPRPVGLMPRAEFSHLVACLHEETNEFIEACTDGMVIDAVDALIDMMYFAVGGLWKMGLSQEQIIGCMRAIHSANMTKMKAKVARRHVEGAVDAGKPADWVGPETRIAEVLDLSTK